jgi:Fic family protein
MVDATGRAREKLGDLALALEREAAALATALPAPTRDAVIDLLRIANCYYSNRIEGHDTRPGAIERAMRGEYAEDSRARILQREAAAHVEVEKLAEAYFGESDSPEPLSSEGLRWLHREFYNRVPAELRFVSDPITHRRERVEPGEFRSYPVTVGHHMPPEPAEIERFVAHASDRYRVDRLSGLDKVLAVAASHHRMLWIHPFGDGNGRVIRLATQFFARRIGLGGTGLWSASRGLARRRDEYVAALADADTERRHDSDGRGSLSAEALARFTRFYLETCLDQVTFMGESLDLERLAERLTSFAHMRANGMLNGPSGMPLRTEAADILRAVLLRGRLRRGDAVDASGLAERTGRDALTQLISDGLLVSDTPKGPVTVAFPSYAVPYVFPRLYPEGITDRTPQ